MERIDLHTHTSFSHGRHDPRTNVEAAIMAGITTLGFTEHVPRPEEFAYPNDYSKELATKFPLYVQEIRDIQQEYAGRITILLGAEFDYFPGYEDHIKDFINTHRFDYTLGSVHFLETWGFDFSARDWRDMDQDLLYADYARYFSLVKRMVCTGMFTVAAHLDLIKIFSIDEFTRWAQTTTAATLFAQTLDCMAEQDMALELSSAGLRKPCKEIYPCPQIMTLARDRNIPITLASDAHTADTIGFGFETLTQYARSFGYTQQATVVDGKISMRPL